MFKDIHRNAREKSSEKVKATSLLFGVKFEILVFSDLL